eukprot:scaffold22499_cov60-Isochrysis_galbana.AAC.1
MVTPTCPVASRQSSGMTGFVTDSSKSNCTAPAACALPCGGGRRDTAAHPRTKGLTEADPGCPRSDGIPPGGSPYSSVSGSAGGSLCDVGRTRWRKPRRSTWPAHPTASPPTLFSPPAPPGTPATSPLPPPPPPPP